MQLHEGGWGKSMTLLVSFAGKGPGPVRQKQVAADISCIHLCNPLRSFESAADFSQ